VDARETPIGGEGENEEGRSGRCAQSRGSERHGWGASQEKVAAARRSNARGV
jgi:hypothetical protein